MPHTNRYHTPNAAPSAPCESTIPALVVAGAWCRVLYWLDSGGRPRPWFVFPDSVRRYPCDDAGIDRLASVITLAWLEYRARREDARER